MLPDLLILYALVVYSVFSYILLWVDNNIGIKPSFLAGWLSVFYGFGIFAHFFVFSLVDDDCFIDFVEEFRVWKNG